MSYQQCFICRGWGWDVSKAMDRVWLCLPCYVDVLEMRQSRGGGTLHRPSREQRARDIGQLELRGKVDVETERAAELYVDGLVDGAGLGLLPHTKACQCRECLTAATRSDSSQASRSGD